MSPPAVDSSIAEASGDNASFSIIDADQTSELLRLAAEGAVAAVRGTVSEAYVTSSGKTFILRFAGNDSRDFQAVWFPEQFDTMAQAFGGPHGEGLLGQRITVIGPVQSRFGIPRIPVTDPAQIQRLNRN